MSDDNFNKIRDGIEAKFGLDLSGMTRESLATPEKAPTPVKPKVQNTDDILFGSNGIMKNYINSGSQLGDQQKAEIMNNYNLIKPSLTADVKTQVEEYLKQVGIDVNTPIEVPTPEPQPEAIQPNLLQKGVNAIKGWLGQKGGQNTSPTGNVAASNTNQQQDYTAMSDDQLADLALTGDQAAIDELKRRGLL
jgi:hypothetical protein